MNNKNNTNSFLAENIAAIALYKGISITKKKF